MGDQSNRRTVYELEFVKYELTVRARKPSFRGLRLLAQAERVLGVGLDGLAVTGPDRLDALAPAVEAFADALLWWDLRDRGVPVPATLTGIEDQDYPLVVDLVTTWYRRVVMLVEQPPVPDAVEDETEELESELAGLATFTLDQPAEDPAPADPELVAP